MKKYLVSAIILLSFSIICCHPTGRLSEKNNTSDIFPSGCWGVYSGLPQDYDLQANPNLLESYPLIKGIGIINRWKEIEPEPGIFKFDEMIGDKLKMLEKNGMYAWLMVWPAPNAPRWLYDLGIPEVQMYPSVTPVGKPRDWSYQYYLNKEYIRYYHRMLNELGSYIRNLPPHLRDRVLFIQSAEGSTGDGQPYKSRPIDTKYNITEEQWGDFRIESWKVLTKALSDENGKIIKPILVNYDANREKQNIWLKNNLSVIGLKNGMFSHGYHISETKQRLHEWRSFRNEIEAGGKEFFSRGEQDGEMFVYGWSTQNIEQGLYWSAIFATHCGLDMWNVPYPACQGTQYQDAFNFFNKYAGQHDPAKANSAFCALRRGLDAMDTVTYPESTYGSAVRSNQDRYMKIMEEHKMFGAMQGDPKKAMGGGMLNRKREDYNDVGWGITDGNYYRFLKQIDPEETSIGWWHVSPKKSIYSRFARSFDVKSNKNSLHFDLDDEFTPTSGKTKLKVKIIWLDKGYGKWALLYDAKNNPDKQAFTIENNNTGEWLEKSIIINDAFLKNRGMNGSDFTLKNLSDENTIFHLIEVEKST